MTTPTFHAAAGAPATLTLGDAEFKTIVRNMYFTEAIERMGREMREAPKEQKGDVRWILSRLSPLICEGDREAFPEAAMANLPDVGALLELVNWFQEVAGLKVDPTSQAPQSESPPTDESAPTTSPDPTG
jgi:hypothetical protein